MFEFVVELSHLAKLGKYQVDNMIFVFCTFISSLFSAQFFAVWSFIKKGGGAKTFGVIVGWSFKLDYIMHGHGFFEELCLVEANHKLFMPRSESFMVASENQIG